MVGGGGEAAQTADYCYRIGLEETSVALVDIHVCSISDGASHLSVIKSTREGIFPLPCRWSATLRHQCSAQCAGGHCLLLDGNLT